MNRKLLCILPLILLLSVSYFSPPVSADATTFRFPRLDELYMTIAYPYTYSLEAAKACQLDNYVGAIRTSEVNTLRGDPYYWNISMNPGFHMCYIAPNCRPYTPETSGGDWDYHGRTPGFPLYPLNVSQFRMALEVIVSGYKDAWISEIYGYINVRIDQVIPPANAFWFNPCISLYPSDWAVAESILTGAGFAWDLGPDATPHTIDDKWTCPDGTILWDGQNVLHTTDGQSWHSDRYAGKQRTNAALDAWGIFVMPPGLGIAPTSYDVTMRHVKKWNLFFCGIEEARTDGHANPLLFIDDATDSYDELILVAFYNRDHDMYFLCWGLGRNPDYLYDFFDPDVDIYGGDNSPGLNHPGLHRVLTAIKFWLYTDWKLLDSNVNPPCPPTKTVTAGTAFGPMGPFDVAVTFAVEVERVDLADGVFDEELVEGVDYTYVWTVVSGKRYLTITLANDVILNKGDALEVKFAAGTYTELITDVYEMQEIVYLAQFKLYYLLPYLPVYSRNYINLYKVIMAENKWLEGWVDSTGYGSEPTGSTNPWTFNNLHWNDAAIGGSMKWHDGGAVSTLNPITASWVYEVVVLGRIIDAPTAIDPYTHADMPWIVYKWNIEPWSDYNVKNGMAITLYLRNDVYWQDGDHLTAEDVAWGYEFIESLTAPELMPIWDPLIKYEVVDDYQIKLYANTTGLWKFYELVDVNTFPKAAWEDFMGDYDPDTLTDYDAAVAYKPWEVSRNTKPGNTGPTDLTMLYGCGPYYFAWWDPLIGKGQILLKRNPNYWATNAIIATQTELGVDGLIPLIIQESGSTYYTVQFTNVNPTQSITFTYWGAFKDVGKSGPRPGASITLNPYQSVTYTYGPAVPQATGDLGGGSPTPRFFEYDGASDSKDLSLMLRILKKGATGEYIPQKWTIYINNALWRQL